MAVKRSTVSGSSSMTRTRPRRTGMRAVSANGWAGPRARVARSGATQVDDGGQVLLLLQRGGGDPLALQRLGHAAIQEPGGQLDGVTGHHARVEAVEPARAHVVPGALFDHHVVVNAVAPRL